MTVDLAKISSVVEAEVAKAINADRRRTISAINEAMKALIETIESGEEETEEAKPATDTPASTVADDTNNSGDAADSGIEEPYDISEVEDPEAKESDYYKEKLPELGKECKARGLPIPGKYKKLEICKMLILDDEAHAEDEEGCEE